MAPLALKLMADAVTSAESSRRQELCRFLRFRRVRWDTDRARGAPYKAVSATVKALGMNKPAVTHLPLPKTLTEQKSDFTAEGSPPPGKVLTSTPVNAPDSADATPPHVPSRPTIKLKRTPAAARP